MSLVSARNVFDALDKDKYQITLCYITREGRWVLIDDMDHLDSDNELRPLLGQAALETSMGARVSPDVVLPILHGAHGEDGDVQGLARLLHIPFVGPSLIGAAMTMDKDVTKRLLRDAGVPVVDWLTWHTSDPAPSYEQVCEQLGDAVFVKPANAGSSVGVNKALDATKFQAALQAAAEHDSMVLIERAVVAREIELAVLGNEHPEVTLPGEIVPGAEFYSYEDKYAASSAAVAHIPAELDPGTRDTLAKYALTSYRATRGHGMARIDFFVTKDNEIYLNEINSIPGFTNISMYPKLWQHEGMSYAELLDQLISLALPSRQV